MSGLICIIDPLQRELFSITNKYLYKQFKFVATLLRRYWFVEVQTGLGQLANVTHGALGTLCLVDLRGQYDSFGCLFQLSRPYSKEEHISWFTKVPNQNWNLAIYLALIVYWLSSPNRWKQNLQRIYTFYPNLFYCYSPKTFHFSS